MSRHAAHQANVLWFLPTHGDGRYLGSAKGGRAVEVYVDAATGRVISRRQPSGPRLPFTREHLKVAQSAPRSLAQTIAMVEKSTGGRVTEIGLERHAGRYYYEAELAGGRDREVRVDLRTGAVTPVRNR